MGCCDKGGDCCSSKPKTSKRVPWFALVVGVLVVLVALNWQ